MAQPKRGKSSARWAVLVGSMVATASFFVAIINGPPPAQASPQPSSVVSSTPAPSRSFNGSGSNTPFARGFSQPFSPQSPFSSARPRLRSRGS